MKMNYSDSSRETRIARVREVADSIQYGHTASAISREVGPRFLRITDIQNGTVDWDAVPSCNIAQEEIPKYRLSEGDLVFARTGATTGKSFLIHKCPDAVFASYLIRVRASKDVDPRYLAFFFQSPDYWRQIERGKRGIGQPNVNGKTLGEIELPLRPIDEQQRIVSEIEKQFTRLDAGVASLKRAKTALKRYRASVLKAACEGRLVPTEAELARKENRSYETGGQLLQRILEERRQQWDGKGKYKELAAPNIVDLPSLPEGWTWASLEQLMLNITDGDHQPPPQTDSGVPFLVIGDVRSGTLDFGDTRFVSREYANQVEPFRKPARGDILYTLVGSYGIALRVTTDHEFCIQRHIGVLRPHELSPATYLAHILNSPFVFGRASKVATGTAQMTVPLAGLRRIAIPLPPVAEQKRIVAELERRLSVAEELDLVLSANTQRATGLRQSVLQQAFSVELATGNNSR